MGAAEDAERVVREMCDAFAEHDAEALRPFFTDDIVYHNIPMDPAVGIDDTIAFITGFFAMCESMLIETRASGGGGQRGADRTGRHHHRRGPGGGAACHGHVRDPRRQDQPLA